MAYREWICLEHTGYARAKAESWWLRRASAPVPGSVDAALERLQELKEPSHIRIRTKGKYPTYYAQAVLYMDYARLDRHYLVCVSPGARRWTAVRTNADPVHAAALKAKAERIIFADVAPQRIGGPDSFACRFCDFSAQCHEGARAERNCRTCLAVEVSRNGGWRCTRFGHELSRTDQEAGCPEHRFLPDLVAGEQIDVIHGQVVYALRDGSRWVDGGPRVHSIGDIIKRQACRSCGSLSWKVTEGAGPHAAGLRCLSCDTHGGWLQKAEVVA